MARKVVVQYKVKPDRVEEHEALIRDVRRDGAQWRRPASSTERWHAPTA
jgi:hypothetical protein